MFLLDTNIVLELLLDQEKADEVQHFLHAKPREALHVSEFSVYSVGVILFRCKQPQTYIQFVTDVIITGGVRLLRLPIHEMRAVAMATQRFKLDFDDAYQYVVAEKHNLQIISFDNDFDHTERGRKTPNQAG